MILLDNKKVRFDYEILDTLEVGIALEGWEVKSLRLKNANIKSSWVKLRNDQLFLVNLKIAEWKFTQTIMDPLRERRLLAHKSEISKMATKIYEKKYTLVPLKIYIKIGKIKCLIALAKGRKKYEKKQVLKERSLDKEAKQMLKNY